MGIFTYYSAGSIFVEKYLRNSSEIFAASAKLIWLTSSLSRLIHIIFPSRSICNLFDLSKYLSMVFILIGSNPSPSNFRKFLTLGYPPTSLSLSRKYLISSSEISFEGRGLFFVVFLDLIIMLYWYDLKDYLEINGNIEYC